MLLNEYQTKARETAIYPQPMGNFPVYTGLSLAGEAGELAGKLGKIVRDEESIIGPHRSVELAYELGDLMWNVANFAADLGYDMETICQMNLDKLASRRLRGVITGDGDNR